MRLSNYLAKPVILACLLCGCGPTIVKNADPVEVKIKVTSGGKPIDKVNLSLQPISESALQSQAPVVNGVCTAKVVPGVYTYYVDSGESEAAVQKIPAEFRRGALDRKLEITEAGELEVQLN